MFIRSCTYTILLFDWVDIITKLLFSRGTIMSALLNTYDWINADKVMGFVVGYHFKVVCAVEKVWSQERSRFFQHI